MPMAMNAATGFHDALMCRPVPDPRKFRLQHLVHREADSVETMRTIEAEDPHGTLRLDQKRNLGAGAQRSAPSVVVVAFFAGFTCSSSQRSVSHNTCRTDSRAAYPWLSAGRKTSRAVAPRPLSAA